MMFGSDRPRDGGGDPGAASRREGHRLRRPAVPRLEPGRLDLGSPTPPSTRCSTGYGRCTTAIPAREQQAVLRLVPSVGSMYGVRAQDMPATSTGSAPTSARGRDQADPRARRHHLQPPPEAAAALRPADPRPPVARGAGCGRPPSPLLVVGAFPSTFRKRWGIRWSPVHEAAYQSQLVALRAVTARCRTGSG